MLINNNIIVRQKNINSLKNNKKNKTDNNTPNTQYSTKNIPNSLYFSNIHFVGKYPNLNTEKIKSLHIPNLQFIEKNSLRGESLAHKCNLRFIPIIKDCGIKQIIDLKTSDFSKPFQQRAEKCGLSYMHFPMDADKTPTRDIIDKLPEFFKKIDEGNFYIACAQGLHRTDIAMSINYLFNKNAGETPPVLYGHKREAGLRCEDICKRCNSIFKELTEADREKLGLSNYSLENYTSRKRKLLQFNENKQ